MLNNLISLSLSSQERSSSPLNILVASSGPALTGPDLCYDGDSKLETGRVSQTLRRRGESPPLTSLDAAQDAISHCWLMSSFFIHQSPQVLLHSAALNEFFFKLLFII